MFRRAPRAPMAPTPDPLERYRQSSLVLLSVITIILVGWALKGTYVVTMPLALAFFVAVVLRPLKDALIRHLPRGLRFLSPILTILGSC